MRCSSFARAGLLALALAGCAGAPPAAPGTTPAPALAELRQSSDLPAPLPNDPIRATIWQLDNGLTVYISTDREQPWVSTRIAVRAGSRHDPPESTGLAHYLEHMLFKGTSRLGTLDAAAERPHLDRIAALYAERLRTTDPDRRIALLAEIDRETQASLRYAIPNENERLAGALGITGLNAMTGPDFTFYVSDVPANRLEHWARVEAEKLLDPSFRLFLPELEIVYEEKNRALDNPQRRVGEALSALLYPRHPYGSQLGIGSPEHLKNPDYAAMVAFYRRYYRPNNVAIVLSGDVDAATALPIIRKHFGAWRPQPVPPPPPGALPPLAGRVAKVIEAEGVESVTLAWPAVSARHEDALALQVMSYLVDNAKSGLFNTELVLTQKLPAAGAGTDLQLEAGHFIATGVARHGQPLAEVEQLLLGSLAHLKQGRFQQEDLDAILLNAEIGRKRSLESNDARADEMMAAFLGHEPWERAVTVLARARQVTKADVVRVANRYLGGAYAVVERRAGKFVAPKIAKPKLTPIDVAADRKSAFAREIEALPAAPLEPVWIEEGVHYQRRRLPAGKLLTVQNPRNDLFALEYQFDFGQRREPLLCYALDLLAKSGADELDAAAVQRRLFALGGSIGTSCGLDSVVVSVAGPDESLPALLALLDRWFRRPRFDASDLDKHLANTLTERRNQIEDPRGAASALTELVYRGRHNSAFRLAPANARLARARPEALAALLARLPDHAHRTRYFGPRSADQVARLVGWGTRHRAVPPRPATRYQRVARDTIFYLDREMAQASVDLSFPFGRLPVRDQAAAMVLGEYLGGGLSALVPYEIREARGLAYSAGANLSWGGRPDDEAVLWADMATQPDKTAEALARLVELFRKVPVSEIRLAEAKRALEERYRATRPAPRGILELVEAWDEQGEPRDIRPRLRADIARLDRRAIEAFLARLARTPAAIGITGERARLELPAVARLGRLVETTSDELFGYGPFPDRSAPAAAGPTARRANARTPAATMR